MTTKRPLTKPKGFNYRQAMQVVRPDLVAELEADRGGRGGSYRQGGDHLCRTFRPGFLAASPDQTGISDDD